MGRNIIRLVGADFIFHHLALRNTRASYKKKSSILRINSFQRKDFSFIDFIFKSANSLKGAVQLLFVN